MKNFIVIRNGQGIVAEGDTREELEQAYEAYTLNADGVGASLPAFGQLESCHGESQDGKLCILDTRENRTAAESYYRVGFER